jgi:ribonuclease HIII
MFNDFVTHIGTDESGKGDFFGPLVIAGVMVDENAAKYFLDLGIKDSKKLSDKKMLAMAVEIKKTSPYSVIAISNPKYNELYANMKNLNKLLAWGHARAIENILEKEHCEYALSDKFGDESLILSALMKNGRNIRLEQMCKAESDIAVAAASVLARATFVQKLMDMENAYGLKFQKGCSSLVKDVAKEFIQKHGKDKLKEVCKTHFKTYKEVI